MAGLADLSKNTIEFAVGFALGHALGPALEPLAVTIAQEAFNADPSRAIRPEEAALIAAEGIQGEGWAQGEGAASGIDGAKMAALIELARTAPAVTELVTMLRRGTISGGDFNHGLRKQRRDTRYDAATSELQNERLDPAVIATSVQRGTMRDPGLLPVGPPSAVGKVTPMPVSDLDTLKEAKDSGVDRERLAVMARNVGLPPAPGELLQLLNRGTIEQADFYRGVSEGNTRNEWGPSLITLRRRLLTPHEYAELHLRGWIDEAAMRSGASLSGLEPADTDLLFKVLGRPLAVHQVTTGLARGGHFGGDYADVPEPYLSAMRESNVRPEWGNLAYANRYTLPSAFVIRALLKDGALSAAQGETLLVESGWPPDLAKLVAEHSGPGGAGQTTSHVTKAENHLWNTIHRSYVADEATDAEAHAALDQIKVPADQQASILALWQHERETHRRTLTETQIRKAFHSGAFTRAEALARLEALGISAADADVVLGQ